MPLRMTDFDYKIILYSRLLYTNIKMNSKIVTHIRIFKFLVTIRILFILKI